MPCAPVDYLWHVEDVGHPGMGDLIAAAVRHTVDAAGWLVLPGDLPLVQPATLQAIAQVLRDQRAVVAWPEFGVSKGAAQPAAGSENQCGWHS